MTAFRHVFWAWLALCLAPLSLAGQSDACDARVNLCGQVDSTLTMSSPLDLTNAVGLQGVFDANYVQVVVFHTTFLPNEGEGVDVVLSAPSCGGAYQAMVFLPNPFDVCNALEYVPVSPLMVANGDTVLVTDPLYYNTDYVLLLGSNTPGCSVQVTLEGRSMSIDACCASNIDYGETANVEVLGSDPQLGYDWVPSEFAVMVDNQLAELSPYETTTFEVTAYVEGCAYSDAVLVAVGAPVEVPNAFSPNNDSFNDTWEIAGLSQFEYSVLEVFDRWGQPVFRSVSYPNPWNGTHRGKPSPAGTYYYVIHLNEPNANLAPLTGYVAIIR